VEWLVGFGTFIAVSVGAQWLALSLYEAYWVSSGAGSAPIPEGTIQAVSWAVGAVVGFLAGRYMSDHKSS
jgi:hypothetical protein